MSAQDLGRSSSLGVARWSGPVGGLLVALAMVVLLAGPASADLGFGFGGGSPVNVAVAWNFRPFTTQYVPRWDQLDTEGPTVTVYNAAEVLATCSYCRTAAVAFQIVLASRVSHLNPANNGSAIALNCVQCDTAAVAAQFVVASNGDVSLTPTGQNQLAGLRQAFSQLTAPGATPESIEAGSATINDEVVAVLQSQVVATPPPGPPSGPSTLLPSALTPTPSASTAPAAPSVQVLHYYVDRHG